MRFLGLSIKDTRFLIMVTILTLTTPILLPPFPESAPLAQFNPCHAVLRERFAIYVIFTIGRHILVGLSRYPSFVHADVRGGGGCSFVRRYNVLN